MGLALSNIEKELLNQKKVIVGIDEVGRGCIAGPIYSAGYLLDTQDIEIIAGVNDSKQLTEKKRQKIFDIAQNNQTNYVLASRSNDDIDKFGIVACLEANIVDIISKFHEQLHGRDIVILLDGSFKDIENTIKAKGLKGIELYQVIKGDTLHYSIALGSIIAKVSRDSLMEEYAIKYPKYGFDEHKGYGTAKHIKMLKEFGICDIHRKSFEPIRSIVGFEN